MKIRGFRIELGEIETLLNEHPLVHQAIVEGREDENGHKRLVAYLVPRGQFDKAQIVNFLKQQLPSYMVPAIFVEMEAMPLNANGKINRKALAKPNFSPLSEKKYVAPQNEIEEGLAVIWLDLLNLDQVGVEDNFFELGGDSIISIQMVSRAKKAGFELQPKDVFEYQTIAQLAQKITASDQTIEAEQGLLLGAAGLLPIQRWFFELPFEARDHFNQSTLYEIDKQVTPHQLERAVEKILFQNDALRFKYTKEGTNWEQNYTAIQVIPKVFVTEKLTAGDDALAEAITALCNRYQASLSIQDGKLIQVVWMEMPEQEKYHRLLIVIHHLAVDAVSWFILKNQLQNALLDQLKGIASPEEAKTSAYRQWY
ncbi:MAG: condensation domain-containing protein, partial [Bacteroidota bacterium]